MKKSRLLTVSLAVSATILLAGCNRVLTPPEPGNAPISSEVSVSSENPAGSEESAEIANPWSDSSLEEIEGDLGIKVSIPKNVSQIGYRKMAEEKLYEINFVYENLGYDYRLKKTDALEDISGLYYEWTASYETPVGDYTATDYRAENGEETVDHIIWYDTKEGVTHSLSTSARDLDGFDIAAIAEMLIGIGSDDADYYTLYTPVMDEIFDTVENGYDYEKEYEYVSNAVMEKVNYGDKDKVLNELGFVLEDVSGDGIPELIIGEDQTFAPDSDPNRQSYIYQIFTCKDNGVVCAVDGWSRNNYRYLGDGEFFNVGSSGAMFTLFAKLHLSTDGTEQIIDDCYFTYDKNGGDMVGYYHNTTGEMDPDKAEEVPGMDAEKFWEIEEDCDFELMDWTPIKDW